MTNSEVGHVEFQREMVFTVIMRHGGNCRGRADQDLGRSFSASLA